MNKPTEVNPATVHFLYEMLSYSEQLDKLCTWIVAGTGAIAAVAVSNLKEVTEIAGTTQATWMFAMLSISFVLAIAAKSIAVRITSVQIIIRSLSNSAGDFTHEQIAGVLPEFRRAMPWWVKFQIDRDVRASKKDPIHGLKLAVRRMEWQKLFISLQSLTLLAFFVVAAYGIGS